MRRLERVLRKRGLKPPFFRARNVDFGTLTDEHITGAVMHRGKDGRGGGSNPSTLELGTIGLPGARSGTSLRLDLHPDALATLAALLDVTPELIADRFYGRIGAHDVDDTGKRFATSYTAASWVAVLHSSRRLITPAAGQTLHSVIGAMTNYLDPLYGMNLHFHGDSDLVAAAQEPTTFTDGLDKYVTEPGILMQERRNGETHVMPVSFRKDYALAVMPLLVPILRRQGIAPAAWRQPNEGIGLNIKYTFTNSQGVESTGSASSPADGRAKEQVEVDWSYIKTLSGNDQLFREAMGRVYEASPVGYRMPKLTIDLLHLLDNGSEYYVDLARQVLMLEAGNPVYLSGDWPYQVRGIHFAEGITETIGPNEWKFDLSLVPWAEVTGEAPSPEVPPRAWDSSTSTWDDDPLTWDQH